MNGGGVGKGEAGLFAHDSLLSVCLATISTDYIGWKVFSALL